MFHLFKGSAQPPTFTESDIAGANDCVGTDYRLNLQTFLYGVRGHRHGGYIYIVSLNALIFLPATFHSQCRHI